MRVVFAEQYNVPAIFVETDDTADAVITRCREEGAVYYEDGPDDECFVIVLRPKIGPEIYTESALRRSIG